LPAFADYLLREKLDEFVTEQIRVSREVNLPLLKYFEGMAEEQILGFAREGSKDFLSKIAANQTAELISSSSKQWLANELPKIKKDQIVQEDIFLVGFVRKNSFLKLLPAYTSDISLILNIVKEIDTYIHESQLLSTTIYVKILQDRIEEHVHLIEKINNTSPGIIYVFDLIEKKEIYSNDNLEKILGYTHEDLEVITEYPLLQIIHPADRESADEYLKSLDTIQDGEIRSFRFRARNKKGDYRWMRNYESIFKRTADGKPWQIIGISLDVDREKKTAEQLQAREEQLLEAQKIAGMGSYEWNVYDLAQTHITPQVYEILNLQKGDQFHGFLKNIHPADRENVRKIVETLSLKDQNLSTNAGIKQDQEKKLYGLKVQLKTRMER